MAKHKVHVVTFRRKREGRTNYKKRLSLLTSRKHRLVIRKTNSFIVLQFIDYSPGGDNILMTYFSKNLDKEGWKYSCKNIPAAYLAGLVAGKKALEKNIKEAILDIGLQTPIKGSRIYAALKGVIDAGINVPHGDDIFPAPERLSGKHLENKEIEAMFEKIKSKLIK